MKTIFIRIAKILAGLVVAVLVIYTTLLILSGLSLRNAYNELRQAGRPMTLAEIIPPPVPACENAAPLYDSAFSLLESESIGDQPLLMAIGDAASAYMYELTSDVKPENFEKMLANPTFVLALDLIEQATARPKCNFNIQYNQGATTDMPYLNNLLKMGQILSAKTLLEARQSNSKRAWQTIETNLRMTNARRNEPTFINLLVWIGQLQNVIASIRNIYELCPPDDDTAARLSELLAGADDKTPFVRAMDGERLLIDKWAFIISDTSNRREFSLFGQNRWKWTYGLILASRPARQADRAMSLRSLSQGAKDATKPFWTLPHLPPSDQIESIPWYGVDSRMVMPGVSQSIVIFAELQANVRVTCTGIALKRHKNAFGSYPATLAEIDPRFLAEMPIDPFTGKSLVYRPEGDGFVLYSLGENLQDDGGAEPHKVTEEAMEANAFDIVWRTAR